MSTEIPDLTPPWDALSLVRTDKFEFDPRMNVVRVDTDGSLVGANGHPVSAPAVLVLAAGEPVPPGTAAGTIIARLPGDVVVFADDFARADGAVGNGWTITAGWLIAAGVLTLTGPQAAITFAFAPNATLTTRDFVQADVDGVGSTGVEPFLILGASARASSFSGYGARYNPATTTFELYRYVGGTGTLVASGSGTLPPSGVLYNARLEREGADLNFLVNGLAKVTWTDPSPLSGGHFCGIRSVSLVASRWAYVDNFSFGDLAA